MSFSDVDGIAAEGIDDLEVMSEHIRVLVIFGGDVLLDRVREGSMRRLAKGYGEDVVAVQGSIVSTEKRARPDELKTYVAMIKRQRCPESLERALERMRPTVAVGFRCGSTVALSLCRDLVSCGPVVNDIRQVSKLGIWQLVTTVCLLAGLTIHRTR